ncbi:MAG: hypothetical protein EA343_16275 [Nodularia sp. (in: Bacteria)]|nr:MAG: hypothetical protein EA343_16275 [Nodularia sp. (in: cyanobacteria)]
MDALLLTLINAAVCVALPKLVSKILARKSQLTQPLTKGSTSLKATIETTSFPYCTTYLVTGNQFCKFKPQFCSKCSPN